MKKAEKKRKRTPETKRKAEWAEFVREDRDWDWAYLLDMILFKLKRMQKCLGKGVCADRRKTAERIGKVVNLLQRAYDDKYHDDLMAAFEEKYGKRGFPDVPRVKEPNGLVSYPFKVTYGGKEPTPQMGRELRSIYRKADRMLQRDLDKGFAMMSKWLRFWWE